MDFTDSTPNMKISYSRFAGSSVERLAALSDGIFAVVMTLPVLELHDAAKEAIHTEADPGTALYGLAPATATCLLSFLTLGIFWNGQQAQLSRLARSDRHLTRMHIGFLFPVSILSFSTTLLAGMMRSVCWSYTMRNRLTRAGGDEHRRRGGAAADRGGAIALCRRRIAVRVDEVGRHRVFPSDPAEFCDWPAHGLVEQDMTSRA